MWKYSNTKTTSCTLDKTTIMTFCRYHIQSYKSDLFVSVNDVYPISSTAFYVTNDHYLSNKNHFLQLFEDISGYCMCNVVFVKDGIASVVLSRLCYANGISLGSNNRLYVVECLGQRVSIFNRVSDTQLSFVKSINTPSSK
jgi:hypothetical protein